MWFVPDEAFAAEQRRSVEELQEEIRGRWDLGWVTLLGAVAMHVDTIYIYIHILYTYICVRICACIYICI